MAVRNLSESVHPSSPLFNSEGCWATELFSSHGDWGHVIHHVSCDDSIAEDQEEDFFDALTDVLQGLGELTPYFKTNKFFDRNIKVVPSMHDNESVRFDIYEALPRVGSEFV